MIKGYAALVEAKAGTTVLAQYEVEGLPECAFEVVHAAVMPAELIFQRCPSDELCFTGVDPESWLGLSEQALRLDKWSVCRVQAAAICDSLVK